MSSPLDRAWAAVNALGGVASSSYERGFVDAIGKALEEIERLGGEDPLSKPRSAYIDKSEDDAITPDPDFLRERREELRRLDRDAQKDKTP